MGRNWQNNRPSFKQNYRTNKEIRYNHVSGFKENYETSRYGSFNHNNYSDPMVEDYNNAYLMKENINNTAMCLTSLIQKFESEYLKVEKRFSELKQTPVIKDMNYIRSFCYRYDRFRRDLQSLGSLLEDLSPTTEMLHSMIIDLTLYIGESENSNYIDTMVISRLNMLLGKIDNLQRDSCDYDEVYIARARAGTTWDAENQKLVLDEANPINLDEMPTEEIEEKLSEKEELNQTTPHTVENTSSPMNIETISSKIDTIIDYEKSMPEEHISAEEEKNEIILEETHSVRIVEKMNVSNDLQITELNLIENNEMPTREEEQKLIDRQELSQTTPHASEITSSLLIAKPESKEVDTVVNYEKPMLEEYVMPDQADEMDEGRVDEKYLDENTEEIKVSTELEDTEVEFRPGNKGGEVKTEDCGADLKPENINQVKIEDSKLETILNKKDNENPSPPYEDLKSKLRENTESTAKSLDAPEEIDLKLLPKEENKTETLTKLPIAHIKVSQCMEMSLHKCKRMVGDKQLLFSSKDKIGRKRGNRIQTKNVRKNTRKRLQRSITHDMSHEKLACREYVTKSDKFIYNLYMFSLRGRVKLSKDKN